MRPGGLGPQTLEDSLSDEGGGDTHGRWPIRNWSSTGFQTLDSLSKVSLSNASTVAPSSEAEEAKLDKEYKSWRKMYHRDFFRGFLKECDKCYWDCDTSNAEEVIPPPPFFPFHLLVHLSAQLALAEAEDILTMLDAQEDFEDELSKLHPDDFRRLSYPPPSSSPRPPPLVVVVVVIAWRARDWADPLTFWMDARSRIPDPPHSPSLSPPPPPPSRRRMADKGKRAHVRACARRSPAARSRSPAEPLRTED